MARRSGRLSGGQGLRPCPLRLLWALLDGVKLDSVDDRVVTDRTGVGGPSAERFEFGFACPSKVGSVDGSEGDQLDRVNLDLLDKLTERAEITDACTSVVHEHGRNDHIIPAAVVARRAAL